MIMSKEINIKFDNVKSELSDENHTFSCDINSSKLNYCVYNELQMEVKDLIKYDIRSDKIKKALNCLDTGLNSCLGKHNNAEFDIKSEFHVNKDEHDYWKIREILLKITPYDDDRDLKEGIKECLKFYRDYCTLQDVNIKVSVEVSGEML
jgi:hypothetical protein